MPYTINNYNGNELTVVNDEEVNDVADLRLIGKNYVGYGEIQNENFVFLLENFAGTVQPPRPLIGQLWYNSTTGQLKFYDKTLEWKSTSGIIVSDVSPDNNLVGDLWYDSVNDKLKAWNGTEWIVVGPATDSGNTKIEAATVVASTGSTQYILKARVNGIVICVFSATQFTLQVQNPVQIPGFTDIKKGLTLVSTSGFMFSGTASNAEKLGGDPATSYQKIDNATANDIISSTPSTDIKTYSPAVLHEAIASIATNVETPPAGTNDTSIATAEFVQTTVGGNVTKSVTGGTVTLSSVESGQGRITITGVLSSNCTLVLHADTLPRTFLITNETTGNFSLSIKGSAQSIDPITIPRDLAYIIEYNGIDVKNVGVHYSSFSDVANSATTSTTAVQFDNSTNIATTAFVQRALGNIQGLLAADQQTALQLTASDAGKIIHCGYTPPSSTYINLPDTTTLNHSYNGIQYHFNNTGGAAQVVRTYTDTITYDSIVMGAELNRLSIAPGESLTLTLTYINSKYYWLPSGSTALKNRVVGPFTYTVSADLRSAWQYLPSGLLIQTQEIYPGVGISPSGIDTTIAYPVTYTTWAHSYGSIGGSGVESGGVIYVRNNTLSTCSVFASNPHLTTTVIYNILTIGV